VRGCGAAKEASRLSGGPGNHHVPPSQAKQAPLVGFDFCGGGPLGIEMAVAQGTGARLGEIAPLSAADVKTDELTNIHSIVITEDLEQGRRLKTSGSRRGRPVLHSRCSRLVLRTFTDHTLRAH
jgi:hypothetical protein